jgi:hypothetical protein
MNRLRTKEGTYDVKKRPVHPDNKNLLILELSVWQAEALDVLDELA